MYLSRSGSSRIRWLGGLWGGHFQSVADIYRPNIFYIRNIKNLA